MSFMCKIGCSECCGIVPISRETIANNLENTDVPVIKTLPFENEFILETEDGLCAFLDRKMNLCKIYAERPDICEEYGTTPKLPCPYIKTDGTHRNHKERRIMRKIIDKTVNRRIKKIEMEVTK